MKGFIECAITMAVAVAVGSGVVILVSTVSPILAWILCILVEAVIIFWTPTLFRKEGK